MNREQFIKHQADELCQRHLNQFDKEADPIKQELWKMAFGHIWDMYDYGELHAKNDVGPLSWDDHMSCVIAPHNKPHVLAFIEEVFKMAHKAYLTGYHQIKQNALLPATTYDPHTLPGNDR